MDTLRQQFGRVAWTHKTLEKYTDIESRQATTLKWLEVILIALTTGSTVGVLMGAGRAAIASAILSAVSLAITLVQLRFNPDQEIARAMEAARRLWIVRESYFHLLADLRDGRVSSQEAALRRDALVAETAAIYQIAPRTTQRAYDAASRSLKEAEELTLSDAEIDRFLPASLHRASIPPGADAAGA